MAASNIIAQTAESLALAQVAFDLLAHAVDDHWLASEVVPRCELLETTPVQGDMAIEFLQTGTR